MCERLFSIECCASRVAAIGKRELLVGVGGYKPKPAKFPARLPSMRKAHWYSLKSSSRICRSSPADKQFKRLFNSFQVVNTQHRQGLIAHKSPV